MIRLLVPLSVRPVAVAFERNRIYKDGHLVSVERHAFDLTHRIGEIVEIGHENADDTTVFPRDMAQACESAGTAYWAMADVHEKDDPKGVRGRRFLGFVVYSLTGKAEDRRELPVPYEAGHPGFDAETLRAAKVPEADIDALLRLFPDREVH
jgi:hypothetical protein